MLEKYSLLFIDTLVSNLVLIGREEVAVHTMKIFALDNTAIIFAVCCLGYLFACAVNFYFGKLCYFILAYMLTASASPRLNISEARCGAVRELKLLPVIIFLSAVPFFGKFIIFFCGFCNVGFLRAVIFAIIAKAIYYCYLLLS